MSLSKLASFVALVLIVNPAAKQVRDTLSQRSEGVSDAASLSSSTAPHSALVGAIEAALAEEAKLTASDASGGNRFGYAVSIDGDRALVGAPYGSTDSGNFVGVAYVFVRSGTTWIEEAKLTASMPHGDANSGNFGHSVSLLGDRALIGAPTDDVATGAAYVFVRSGSTWSEEQRLLASDMRQFDAFGSSVSLSAERALVGAKAGGTDLQANIGAAYFFLRTGTDWQQEAKVIASDTKVRAEFGASVSLDGDRALIGAPSAGVTAVGTVGAGYFFERDGSTWSETQKVYANDATVSMEFGGSVSLDGTRALIGARYAAGNKGAAYIYSRTGLSWDQEAVLLATDGGNNDNFGVSVALEGNHALVGASNEQTTAGSGAGAAYVFVRSSGTWLETERLTASDADGSEEFGGSVALNDGRALVGSSLEDLPAAGNAGAAFVFGVTPVSVETDAAILDVRLDPPYPNPGKRVVTVGFTLAEPGSIDLMLFDLQGRSIATLASGVHRAGSHDVQFDTAGLPAGIYFLRLRSGSRQSAQQLTLLD